MGKKQILGIAMLFCQTLAFAGEDLNHALLSTQSEIGVISVNQKGASDNLRLSALSDSAFIYGAQKGRFSRWQEIEHALSKRNTRLSQIFDFSVFYLHEGKLQPPILDIAKDSLTVTPNGMTRITTKALYRVRVPASFVAAPLTWQRVLLPDGLASPLSPSLALLPRTSFEKTLWQKKIADGFREGVLQANREFDLRLNALNAAYQGMALYTELSMRGMIEAPKVVISKKASDADDTRLSVGTKEEVIARRAYWISNPNAWRAVTYKKPFLKSVIGC